MLKLTEGLGKALAGQIKDILYKSTKNTLAGLVIKKDMDGFKKMMDYKEHGGAPLLGTAKPVIKAHGSSDARALKNAVRQAVEFVKGDVNARILTELQALKERGEQDKAYMDAAETQQADAQAAEPQQPRPVVPIILTSEKPAEKVKEITARLEQGVQAIFDSDRYKEFLTAMSKFHDYILNNTILIAMQGGNLVMGFRQWEKEFDRHVKKGDKCIKILSLIHI